MPNFSALVVGVRGSNHGRLPCQVQHQQPCAREQPHTTMLNLLQRQEEEGIKFTILPL